jgi:hypothetical protein
MSVDLGQFEKVLLGKQCAVGLSRRGVNDPHVILTLLSEDDGNWFVMSNGMSSYWIHDLASVVAEAIHWCEQNCEPDFVEGLTWGWKFRTRQ